MTEGACRVASQKRHVPGRCHSSLDTAVRSSRRTIPAYHKRARAVEIMHDVTPGRRYHRKRRIVQRFRWAGRTMVAPRRVSPAGDSGGTWERRRSATCPAVSFRYLHDCASYGLALAALESLKKKNSSVPCSHCRMPRKAWLGQAFAKLLSFLGRLGQ